MKLVLLTLVFTASSLGAGVGGMKIGSTFTVGKPTKVGVGVMVVNSTLIIR